MSSSSRRRRRRSSWSWGAVRAPGWSHCVNIGELLVCRQICWTTQAQRKLVVTRTGPQRRPTGRVQSSDTSKTTPCGRAEACCFESCRALRDTHRSDNAVAITKCNFIAEIKEMFEEAIRGQGRARLVKYKNCARMCPNKAKTTNTAVHLSKCNFVEIWRKKYDQNRQKTNGPLYLL